MSRTFRNKQYNSCAFRSPKTTNELRQIRNLLSDIKDEDYYISGVNHLHRRLNIPTAWDDVVCSAYYESDHQK